MNSTTGSAPEQSAAGFTPAAPRNLYRPRQGRMLAGVASGLAGYAGMDVLLVRIGFAVLTFLGGAGIPLYLACWLLIPGEDSGRSIAAVLADDLRARDL